MMEFSTVAVESIDTGGITMKTRRMLVLLVLFALAAPALVACATDSLEAEPSLAPLPEGSSSDELWTKIEIWLAQVARSAATVPIIGPLITGILGELAPESHWCVGAVIIFLILSALGGGSSASRG